MGRGTKLLSRTRFSLRELASRRTGWETGWETCLTGRSPVSLPALLFHPDRRTFMLPHNRREFLADVGGGMLAASVGPAVACDLGLSTAFAGDGPQPIKVGCYEELASLMQDTPADKVLPILVKELADGTELKELVAAGALANAREFGRRHYEGHHTFKAPAPAYELARVLPDAQRQAPVLKAPD